MGQKRRGRERERERRCEKPPSPGRGRGRGRLPLPPRTPSLTRTPRWRPPPPPRSQSQPPRLPAAPGRVRGRARTSAGYFILTIGERNYRAYGNHGLGLLLLNSELSPTASLLCPAPPQRRTDRHLPPHCAGAPCARHPGSCSPGRLRGSGGRVPGLGPRRAWVNRREKAVWQLALHREVTGEGSRNRGDRGECEERLVLPWGESGSVPTESDVG